MPGVPASPQNLTDSRAVAVPAIVAPRIKRRAFEIAQRFDVAPSPERLVEIAIERFLDEGLVANVAAVSAKARRVA